MATETKWGRTCHHSKQAIQIPLSAGSYSLPFKLFNCHESGATKKWLLQIFHIAGELDRASKSIFVNSFAPIGLCVCVCVHIKQHERRHASCTWAQLEWETAPGQRTIGQKAAKEPMVCRGIQWTTELTISWIRPIKDIKQHRRFSVKWLHENVHKIWLAKHGQALLDYAAIRLLKRILDERMSWQHTIGVCYRTQRKQKDGASSFLQEMKMVLQLLIRMKSRWFQYFRLCWP